MRLKLYCAATLSDAIAQLRRELGPEALILSSRRVAGGVELTAALDRPDEPPRPSQPSPPPSHHPLAGLDAAYHAIPPALAACLGGPDLARCLAAALRFGRLPIPAAAHRPLLLAGMPGAGKTLSVARLATRLVLGGVQPLVITADGRRAGGAEELAAYTRLLGLTLLAASTPGALARAVAQATADTPVLIDTAGINPFDAADTDDLAALIHAAAATPVLILTAGGHPEETAEQAAAFAALGAGHLLPTRLDIVRRLGGVLAAAAAGLVLTEGGVGTGATDGLVPITPHFLAERLLRPPPRGSPRPNEAAAPGHRQPVFPSAHAHQAAARNVQDFRNE